MSTTDLVLTLIPVYLIVAAFWLALGGLMTASAYRPSEKRKLARWTLLAPVWPLALWWLVLTGIGSLVYTALRKDNA